MDIKIDELIRSGRKTIALVITPDARLVVRAPFKTPAGYIESLVAKKNTWIVKKIEEIKRKTALNPEKGFVDGEVFLYLGNPVRLAVVDGPVPVRLEDGELKLSKSALNRAAYHVARWYRERATEILFERVELYSGITGIRPGRVKVTGARRRWGSCGPGGSLNFAWRLVMAPLQVIDYVVAHELAHVLESNHSPKYWAIVGAIMPDYKKYRKWLKENQALLDLPG